MDYRPRHVVVDDRLGNLPRPETLRPKREQRLLKMRLADYRDARHVISLHSRSLAKTLNEGSERSQLPPSYLGVCRE